METRLVKQKFEFMYPQPLLGSDQEREDPFALLNEMDAILREGLAETHDLIQGDSVKINHLVEDL